MHAETAHKCPACGKPLLAEKTPEGWAVWCGYGPCRSRVSNDGVVGTTIDFAAMWLIARVHAEADAEAVEPELA